jgi:hypothetical protein
MVLVNCCCMALHLRLSFEVGQRAVRVVTFALTLLKNCVCNRMVTVANVESNDHLWFTSQLKNRVELGRLCPHILFEFTNVDMVDHTGRFSALLQIGTKTSFQYVRLFKELLMNPSEMMPVARRYGSSL